ncbi:unnamed protein product [Cyprideis torosa]|uniref:beta-galactoside alpha-(2,6)-sialyltransferase n=1 Tax=Cyprideis torosa TaxID=163714 RepID=A0A7R8WKG8_9CRUS|nr:unnamed protein product [Cyprideis torosa]CAG0897064.1 unnamed protein product [Cyprideis torosa]
MNSGVKGDLTRGSRTLVDTGHDLFLFHDAIQGRNSPRVDQGHRPGDHLQLHEARQGHVELCRRVQSTVPGRHGSGPSTQFHLLSSTQLQHLKLEAFSTFPSYRGPGGILKISPLPRPPVSPASGAIYSPCAGVAVTMTLKPILNVTPPEPVGTVILAQRSNSQQFCSCRRFREALKFPVPSVAPICWSVLLSVKLTLVQREETPSAEIKPTVFSLNTPPFDVNPIGQLLPKSHLIPRKKFNTCVAVSNAGSLLGSGLGSFIDSHDFVLRFNHAPTEGFEADVGSRTDARIINDLVMRDNDHWKYFYDPDKFDFFHNDLFKNITLIAWHPFGGPGNFEKVIDDKYLPSIHSKSGPEVFQPYFKRRKDVPHEQYYFLHPDFVWNLWQFLQEFSTVPITDGYPTSGFIGGFGFVESPPHRPQRRRKDGDAAVASPLYAAYVAVLEVIEQWLDAPLHIVVQIVHSILNTSETVFDFFDWQE